MEKKFIPFIKILVLSGMTVQAQDNDSTKVVHLSEVNVVASRTTKENFHTPRSVTVITASELMDAGYGSVAEALGELGGVYMTGTSQVPGANESIFLRGANSNQTTILVDGVRFSDASTVNNTADLAELSLADVDRIEILRGAHSTLYGSAAIGGVISITTKHGSANGLHGNASVIGGTFGKQSFYQQGSGSLNYRTPKGFFAGGGIEKILSGGMDATRDTVTDPSVFKHRDLDRWDRLTWFANAGCRKTDLLLDLSWRNTLMKTDLDQAAYVDDDNYTLDFIRNTATGNLSWNLNHLFSTQLNFGYSSYQREALNDSSIADASGTYDHNYSENNYSGKSVNADLQINGKFKDMNLLAGFSFVRESMEQEDYYYSTAFGSVFEMHSRLDTIPDTEALAGYFQADLNSGLLLKNFDNLNLVAGIRYNRHSDFFDEVTYEVNLGYKISSDALLFASWSTGFNAPSLYQLNAPDRYLPYDGAPSTGLTRGNHELSAERSSSFEIGIKERLGNKISYSISYFYSVTENLIDYVYLWDQSIGLDTLGNDFSRDDYRGDRYLNIGKQTTSGLDWNVEARLSSSVSFLANGSIVSGILEYHPTQELEEQTQNEQIQLYSNGTFLNKSVEVAGLTRRPSNATLALRLKTGKYITLIPSLYYVGPRTDIYYDNSLGPFGALASGALEGYTLVNVAVRIKPSDHLQFAIRGENLANKQYEEIFGFSSRGRSIFLQAGYHF